VGYKAIKSGDLGKEMRLKMGVEWRYKYGVIVADVQVIQIALLGGERGSSRCIFEKWARPIAQCLVSQLRGHWPRRGKWHHQHTWIGRLSPGRNIFEDF
jgi:hypothetical protein